MEPEAVAADSEDVPRPGGDAAGRRQGPAVDGDRRVVGQAVQNPAAGIAGGQGGEVRAVVGRAHGRVAGGTDQRPPRVKGEDFPGSQVDELASHV